MNTKEIFAKFPQVLLFPTFFSLVIIGVLFLIYISDSGNRIFIIPALACFLLALIISKQIDKSKKKKEKEPDEKLNERLYF